MAALALQEALLEKSAQSKVEVLDGLHTISPLLRKISQASYLGSLRYFPKAWDRAYARNRLWSATLKKPLGVMLGKRMVKRVIDPYRPDIVVATHAYCLSALAEAKKHARVPFSLVSVCTDFHVNDFWIHPSIDAYVVANQEIGQAMQRTHDVRPESIFPLGIPLRTSFAKESGKHKKEWREQLGLRGNQFTIMISGGEGGYGKIREVLERLIQMGRPLQILVATGKNRELRQQLSQIIARITSPHSVHVLGYIKEIWAYIGASDVMITKPGGITCSEALAMQTPLILYDPLPGQERKNSQFLCEHQLAYEAKHVEDIVQILERWQSKPENVQAQSLERFSRPDSAYRAADLILHL
ncbi:MGDG synthase family glycosyltransferase [Brevibacillus migulae]|uniref:MGDG synthase family glycosyltransferase n=1 Tax=Brevibacillus migulae TaxID=1644114 RepID=UPI0014311A0C|nr:glycosyltransferase [Brevibacillus migulae]